ncbi:MAG: hypothetical protein WCP79_05815 [Bacillota bacterium]
MYKIKVALDLKTIPRTIEIYPGLAGTVEIKTNEKRVIDFFLDPLIKYADESLGLRWLAVRRTMELRKNIRRG